MDAETIMAWWEGTDKEKSCCQYYEGNQFFPFWELTVGIHSRGTEEIGESPTIAKGRQLWATPPLAAWRKRQMGVQPDAVPTLSAKNADKDGAPGTRRRVPRRWFKRRTCQLHG